MFVSRYLLQRRINTYNTHNRINVIIVCTFFQTVYLIVGERRAVSLQFPLQPKPRLVVVVGRTGGTSSQRAVVIGVVADGRARFVGSHAAVQI